MRKLLIGILVFLLLVGTGNFIAKGLDGIDVKGIIGLSEKDAEVEETIADLSDLVSVMYPSAEKTLKTTANEMQEAKTEYETQAILSSSNTGYATELEPYEIDYLWTKLGNYAKDENVVIKINLVADGSTVSVTKTDGTVTSRTLCTLKFTVTGTYSNITDFIYDIENDSNLGFRIDDFYMKSGSDGTIVADFSCSEIPVSVGTIDGETSSNKDEDENEETEDTEDEETEEDEEEENTTNNTTSNTTNSTTNTTNTNS